MSRFCLVREGTMMSLFGTVSSVLMASVGTSGQVQLMGADRGVGGLGRLRLINWCEPPQGL